MLLYIIGAIVFAIVSWLIGIGNWAVLIGLVILFAGLIYSNIQHLTKRNFILALVVVVAFTVIEHFFWDIFTTTNILTIICALLLVSLVCSAAKENYGEVAVILILLLVFSLAAPILNAWVPITDQKTQTIKAQINAGENTEGVFFSLKEGLADIWLMLTDPAAWAEKREAKKGKQEDGTLALEITSVKVMPSSVMPKDEYSLMFELKNRGKNDATNVYVGARIDDRAYEHGSYIIRSDGSPSRWLYRAVEDIHPQEQRFESFDIVAPDCASTFKTTAYVEYSYNAIATTNLEFITRDYYDELLSYNKINFKDQLSTASAGPFKLTIRTQYPQPIPVTKSEKDKDGMLIATKFKIYFNAINERDGQAFINDITVDIPKELTLIEGDDCDLIEVMAPEDTSPSTSGSVLGTLYHLKPPEDGKNRKNMCVGPNDMTSFKCEFEYNDVENVDFDKEKTLFLRTGINYTFTYDKTATTTIKSNVAGIETCSEKEDKEVLVDKGLSDDEEEKIKGELETENNGIFTNYCTYENGVCVVQSIDHADSLVSELGQACYDAWANNADHVVANIEISCAEPFDLCVKDIECVEGDNPTHTLSGIDGPTISWPNGNKIYLEHVNEIDIKYTQKSCTLAGLEIALSKKKEECTTPEPEEES